MEVITLPFDVRANASVLLMYGRSYSLSVERMTVEFTPGSDYDEISVYALSTSAFWFKETHPAFVDSFRLAVCGEVLENPAANGVIAVVFDFPSTTLLNDLRYKTSPVLVPAYDTKLLSGFDVTVSDYPFLTIKTLLKSTKEIIGLPSSVRDQIRNVAFMYSPLITKAKGTNVDISYTPDPVVAHANAQFSILVQYVNKTTVNKRCKITLFSRPLGGDPGLIRGSIFTPKALGISYNWTTPPVDPPSKYAEALYDTCQYGAIEPPFINNIGTDFVFEPYDYYGAVSDLLAYLWLVPSNIASKSDIWHVLNADYSSNEIIAYPVGIDKAEFAPLLPYRGGVLTKDDIIFFCPYGQASYAAGKWHYFDTNTFVVDSYPAPVLPDHIDAGLPPEADGYPGFPAYCGGSLTESGLLILAPFGISQQTTWHYVDTNTKTVRTYSVSLPPLRSLMYRGAHTCLANKYVLLCPGKSDGSGNWHYIDVSGTSPEAKTYPYVLPEGEIATTAYSHITTMISPTAASLCIPFNQAGKTRMHTILLETVPSVYIINVPAGMEQGKYVKGVISPTGRIFLIPGRSSGSATWKYIEYPQKVGGDTKIVTYDTRSMILDDYVDAILSFWGDIYLVPNFTSERVPGRGTVFQRIRTIPGKDFDSKLSVCPEINHM